MHEPPNPIESKFVTLYEQNWENARFIKNERLVSANIYALVVAGALSLLRTGSSGSLEITLLAFLLIFSIAALLTSLRLKAELEDCLRCIQAMAREANVESFVSLGEIEKGLVRHVKFRWIFPALYAVSSAGFLALLIHRILFYLRH